MSALTCIVLALIASHQDCQPCPTLHPPKMRRILLAAFKSVLLSTMIVNIASEMHFHAWHSLTQFCMIAYRSSTVPRYLHDLNMSSSSADPWRRASFKESMSYDPDCILQQCLDMDLQARE